jgi:hypothetical protein
MSHVGSFVRSLFEDAAGDGATVAGILPFALLLYELPYAAHQAQAP